MLGVDRWLAVLGAWRRCGGDAVVIFDGYGMPDSGGSVDITAGGVTKTIQLDPDTGRAVVQ